MDLFVCFCCHSDGEGSPPSVSEGDPQVDCGLFQKQSTGLDSGTWRMGMLGLYFFQLLLLGLYMLLYTVLPAY